MGQIRLHKTSRSLLKLIARGKPGDKTSASLVVYRSLGDSESGPQPEETVKDYVSGHRANLLLKNVQQTGCCFPQDL